MTAQTRIVKSIKTFTKAGQVTQMPTTRLANPLDFTSTRSMKLAKDNDTPAIIPNPNRMIANRDLGLARL